MLAGTRCFYRRVEGQEVGLTGDFLYDRDLFSNRAHRRDRAGDRLSARLGVLGRLACNLLRLGGVIGVLLDVSGHLLHGSRGLLGRRCLLSSTLRHLLGGGRELLAARGDVVGCGNRIAHHAAQALDHSLQRDAEDVLVRERLWLDGEVTFSNLLGNTGGSPEINKHLCQSVAQHVFLG